MSTAAEYFKWIEEQRNQVKRVLSLPEEQLAKAIDPKTLLLLYAELLQRLELAEKFCVAAKALAEYKQPLEHVLNTLDAWEIYAQKNDRDKQ